MTKLDEKSLKLRAVMLKTLYQAGRGHLPSACSCLEVLRVLYEQVLHIPNPTAPNRDRFILSKGHGCLALYTVLTDQDFISPDTLASFCAFNSPLGGHPERNLTLGIEASTGSLGHGLSLGVGMALAAKMDNCSHKVFILCGDGETNEGSIWEAMLCAAKHKLNNLCLIIDYNKQQSWGDVSDILPLEPYKEKFQAFGFTTLEINGHDLSEIQTALTTPTLTPKAIIAHTVKGKGFWSLEKNLTWHHKTKLSQNEFELLAKELNI